jgi:hypothetical protein
MATRRITAPRWQDALLSKVRTTLTIDEDVLKWVRIRAARTGCEEAIVWVWEHRQRGAWRASASNGVPG